jgi:signal transduction histidine kinase/CheY-like chemotaxis protein
VLAIFSTTLAWAIFTLAILAHSVATGDRIDWLVWHTYSIALAVLLAGSHYISELYSRREWYLRLDAAQKEKQLQGAKQIEEINNAKTRFIANMSHELRTPLHGIVGMSGCLQATPLSWDQNEYAGIIQTSADMLLGLINDILDTATLEQKGEGALIFQSKPFSILVEIENAFDISCAFAAEKGIDIAHHISRDIPHKIVGDPVRIGQVILNLLNNAIKFTDEGSVWLTASIAEGSSPMLLIKIRDTGRGISRDNQEELFKPFTQFGNAIAKEGAGLGLFISKMIVESTGGSIGMESKENEGSEFWFSIPLTPAPDSPLKLFHVVSERKTVMLVHQVGVVRESIEKYLKERGHSVVLLEEYPTFEDLDEIHAIVIEYDQQVDLLAKSWKEKKKDFLVVMVLGQEKYNFNNKDWKAIHKPIRVKRLFNCIEKPVLAATVPEERKKILSGCRILIAEDNSVNQKVLIHILDKEDCKYVITANGQEVVEKAKEEQFDIILMDWQMPIMDGIEATNQIRKFDPHIPIIGLTAAPNQWKNCLEAGMNDVLTKPFKPAQLQARIARYLHKKVESTL